MATDQRPSRLRRTPAPVTVARERALCRQAAVRSTMIDIPTWPGAVRGNRTQFASFDGQASSAKRVRVGPDICYGAGHNEESIPRFATPISGGEGSDQIAGGTHGSGDDHRDHRRRFRVLQGSFLATVDDECDHRYRIWRDLFRFHSTLLKQARPIQYRLVACDGRKCIVSLSRLLTNDGLRRSLDRVY